MTRTLLREAAPTACLGLLCALLCLGFTPRAGAEGAPPAEDPSTPITPFREGENGIALQLQPQLGDLSAIRERGVLRVLVTYNSTSFFIRDGELHGLVPTLMQAFRRRVNAARPRGSVPLRLIYVPMPLHRIIPALEAGYGDVAAARLTVTPKRALRVDFSEPYIKDVAQVLVTRKDVPPLTDPLEVSGMRIHVVRGSNKVGMLEDLNETLRERGLPGVGIVEADDSLVQEDLLEMTHAGLIDATVCDSFVARLWRKQFSELHVHGQAPLRTGGRIAFAVRPGSPELLGALNAYVRDTRSKVAETARYVISRGYRGVDWLVDPLEQSRRDRLAAVRTYFKSYAQQYEQDWLMLVAQGFAESGLNQSARSRSGAIGIMQIKPSTAKQVGVIHIDKAPGNIHAGVRYMDYLRETYFDDPALDAREQALFSLAAYNAGPNRIKRLRAIAPQMNVDPNRWFGNMEYVVMRKVGLEPVRYVAKVNKYYLAYLASRRVIDERRLDHMTLRTHLRPRATRDLPAPSATPPAGEAAPAQGS